MKIILDVRTFVWLGRPKQFGEPNCPYILYSDCGNKIHRHGNIE